MVEERWQVLVSGVNALNVGTSHSVEKLKRKWFDLKSIRKKAAASYKKELAKRGGSVNKAETPTDLQFKVSEIMGKVCTEGVPGTLLCDTSLNPTKNKQRTRFRQTKEQRQPPSRQQLRLHHLQSKENRFALHGIP